MKVQEFAYDLPPELIAQHPPRERDGGRLMQLSRGASSAPVHGRIVDLPRLLAPGTLMVVNDSRVIPARLWARRESGGRVELLLLERLGPQGDQERWSCMIRSSKTPGAGERLRLERAEAAVTLVERPVQGRCELLLDADVPGRFGSIPLPPYIRRPDDTTDRERYQTVYAEAEGSVAAPTAGLHFTGALLSRLEAVGVELARVTLHVGPGTFQPVRAEIVEQHRMEQERYVVPPRTASAIRRAKSEGRPVLAVGTTVVRTLEASGGAAGEGRTELFIAPGYRFQVVDQLLTNFHLPRSTLLMLVAAFTGRVPMMAAYAEAVRERYRFYSYGDAMLITSAEQP